jgi:hypothetical protein
VRLAKGSDCGSSDSETRVIEMQIFVGANCLNFIYWSIKIIFRYIFNVLLKLLVQCSSDFEPKIYQSMHWVFIRHLPAEVNSRQAPGR